MKPSRTAEWIVDAILQANPRSFAGRARLKAAIEARKLAVRLRDPLISHRIDGIELLLPLSHQLPFYRHDHPRYDQAIGEIARVLNGPVIDVGANVGDTAAAIRSQSEVPILCVEGEPRFYALLEQNAPALEPVELERALVEAPARGRLERGGGTARVVAGDEELPSKPLARILEEHPRFSEPALLKLDTDGMDVPILLANLDLLAGRRPALFFEYDPYLGATPDVFERLAEVGYAEAAIYENTGAYLRTVSLVDRAGMAALHAEYTGHEGARYVDVFALHESAATAVSGLLGPPGGARPLG